MYIEDVKIFTKKEKERETRMNYKNIQPGYSNRIWD